MANFVVYTSIIKSLLFQETTELCYVNYISRKLLKIKGRRDSHLLVVPKAERSLVLLFLPNVSWPPGDSSSLPLSKALIRSSLPAKVKEAAVAFTRRGMGLGIHTPH